MFMACQKSNAPRPEQVESPHRTRMATCPKFYPTWRRIPPFHAPAPRMLQLRKQGRGQARQQWPARRSFLLKSFPSRLPLRPSRPLREVSGFRLHRIRQTGCLTQRARSTQRGKSLPGGFGKPTLPPHEPNVAQTFLSAVSQVFQPAKRGSFSARKDANALPTRMSATQQTGMSAPRSWGSMRKIGYRRIPSLWAGGTDIAALEVFSGVGLHPARREVLHPVGGERSVRAGAPSGLTRITFLTVKRCHS